MTIEINILTLVAIAIVPAFITFATMYKRTISFYKKIENLEKEVRLSDDNVLELERELTNIAKSTSNVGQVVDFNKKTKAL